MHIKPIADTVLISSIGVHGDSRTPSTGIQTIMSYQSNFTTITTSSGVELEVYYEYISGEAPNYNLESPSVGPGSPAEVQIWQVTVAGHDITDIIDEEYIIEWGEQILCSL